MLHTITWHLCWMNERYICTHQFCCVRGDLCNKNLAFLVLDDLKMMYLDFATRGCCL